MSSQAITLAEPRRRRAFFRAGWGKQLMLQALLIFISFTVLFPLLWVVSMSLDPRNLARPDGLNLIPPGASIRAYEKVGFRPVGVMRQYERGIDRTFHDGLLMDLLADELIS